MLRILLVSLGVGAVAGLAARVLMRLVAIDTLDHGEFSVAGTLGIVLLFVISSVGAGLAGLVRRRWLLVACVVVTSALLWYSGLAIGFSTLGFAQDRAMTGPRWVGFWALFAAIMAIALATPYAALRLTRR
jgi:hypothetical protein